MPWDNEYQQYRELWGKCPSELAIFAADYLTKNPMSKDMLSIVDIGCGYGRDELHLSKHLKCRILGIDNSVEAIRIATENCQVEHMSNLKFQCADFLSSPPDGIYDIAFASSVYQLLNPPERERFRDITPKLLKPGGLLFLSTLSVNDPEHFGKGVPVAGELNSFIDSKYVHLCTQEELKQDFGILRTMGLFEHKFDEPRATGETHHHICWLFVGQRG